MTHTSIGDAGRDARTAEESLMTSHHAAGTFTVASWEEDTYQDLAGQEKLTKAKMGFQLSGDLAGDLVSDTLMCSGPDAICVISPPASTSPSSNTRK